MNDIAFSVIINNDGIDDIIFKTIMLKGEKGNSIAGCRLLREIADKLRLSLFYDTDLLAAAKIEYSLNGFQRHRQEETAKSND